MKRKIKKVEAVVQLPLLILVEKPKKIGAVQQGVVVTKVGCDCTCSTCSGDFGDGRHCHSARKGCYL